VPDLPLAPPPPDYRLCLEERGKQLARFSREIEREMFWDTVRTLGACLAWSAAGAIAMGFSFASSDERWAPVIFWGALSVSYSGIAYALLSAYQRQLQRTGDR